MTQIISSQEEVTTTQSSSPAQIVQKTTRVAEPLAKGDAPQQVFDKKKTIIRVNQVIWYILGFVEVLLIFRLVLKMLGADSQVGFTNLIYTITYPLAGPFSGVVGASISGSSMIEWSTIIAGIVYLCIAWGFIYLMDLIYPITPSDVANQ